MGKSLKKGFEYGGIIYTQLRSPTAKQRDAIYLRDKLISRGEDFIFIRTGSQYRILMPETKRCHVFFGSEKHVEVNPETGKLKRYMDGLYLVNMAKMDVEKYYQNNDTEISTDDLAYKPKQFFYNPKSLAESFVNQTRLCAFDVKRCYWTTAFNLGYISEKTYERGLEDKKFKKACHVAIGSLSKKGYSQHYESGKVVDTITMNPDDELLHANIVIRREVENFMNSFKQYENAFSMFYVDCVFMSVSDPEFRKRYQKNPKFIQDHFEAKGYSTSPVFCRVSDTNGTSIKIEWMDKEREDDEDIVSHYFLPLGQQNEFMRQIGILDPELKAELLHKSGKAESRRLRHIKKPH